MKEWIEGHEQITDFGSGDEVVIWSKGEEVCLDLKQQFEQLQLLEVQFFESQLMDQWVIPPNQEIEQSSQPENKSSISCNLFDLFSCCNANVEN